ncbi:MAG: hypothetical protein LBS46_08660, partial [Dysgonamonadaceae bacterium]|nr:hypothetical protein [Dysgonamonadaceae bacterium]
AGEITQEIQADGFVLLSVNEIPRATTYRWYKGDQEVQNTDSRTFLATEDGSYKVAGVNETGEGKHSEPSVVGGLADIFNILTAEYIPRESFRNWIKENLAGGSEVFTNYQAAAYDGEIVITSLQAGDLRGIEYFTSLRKLYCKYNLLASLDVSKNVNLTYLDCGNNTALSTLDISTLTKLDSIDVSYTGIKSLDFSGCKESLKFLKWNANNLTTAQFAATNIKVLTNIKTINLANNNFTTGSLDLSGMSTVESIDLSTCKLTGINLTGCSGLKKLMIGFNSLTSLDLTPCPVLEELYCQRNLYLATLNIGHLTATLKEITYNNTLIGDIDFTQFPKLEYVECQSITALAGKTLNFSQCPELKRLRCESTQISGLNLTGCTKLEELYAYSNASLTGTISLANFKALTLAYLQNNRLTSVDVTGCTALKDLQVYSNQQLTSLTLTGCSELDNLSLQNNKLTSLDLSGSTKLNTLYISNNELGPNLDISNNSLLTFFSGSSGNATLQKIKVWSAFDINNPPSDFIKPATAVWVYEF